MLSRRRAALGGEFDQLGAHHGPYRLFLRRDSDRRAVPAMALCGRGQFRLHFRRITARCKLASRRRVLSTPTPTITGACLETGLYQPRPVVATALQHAFQGSSNFERLFFRQRAGQPVVTRSLRFRRDRLLPLTTPLVRCAPIFIRLLNEPETGETNDECHRETAIRRYAHTVALPRRHGCGRPNGPDDVLATAHPANSRTPSKVAGCCHPSKGLSLHSPAGESPQSTLTPVSVRAVLRSEAESRQ